MKSTSEIARELRAQATKILLDADRDAKRLNSAADILDPPSDAPHAPPPPLPTPPPTALLKTVLTRLSSANLAEKALRESNAPMTRDELFAYVRTHNPSVTSINGFGVALSSDPKKRFRYMADGTWTLAERKDGQK